MNTNVNRQLNKDTNYISVQDVLAEIKSTMRSYFEQGLIDDGTLYPTIRDCLAKLGSKLYPVSQVILNVQEYKADLPLDFRKMVLALGCGNFKTTDIDPLGKIYEATPDTITNFVTKPPKPCIDECGDEFYIVQKFDTYSIEYSEFFPITISPNSTTHCSADCFNKSKSPYEIEIDLRKKKIITNFESGTIYLEYVQNIETTDDLLIPDFRQIIKWIKDACIVTILKEVLYNYPDQSVTTKLSIAERDAGISELNARSFVRANEFSDFYNMRRLFSSRYSKFTNVVFGYNY